MKLPSVFAVTAAAVASADRAQDQVAALAALMGGVIHQASAPILPQFVAPAPEPQPVATAATASDGNAPAFVPDIGVAVRRSKTSSATRDTATATATLAATSAAVSFQPVSPVAASSTSSTSSTTTTTTTTTADPVVSSAASTTATTTSAEPAPVTTQAPVAPAPQTTQAPAPVAPPAPQTTQPPAPAPVPTQGPPPVSSNPCGDITAIVNSYPQGSNSPQDAVNLHNDIRHYVNAYLGMSLPDVRWDDGVAAQATEDAKWSVAHASCQSGGLAHWGSFGITDAKNLGWSNYWYAIFQFVTYDNGGGSECQQWFNDRGVESHFSNMMQGGSRMGCGPGTCPGGPFGPVIGCDYAA
ncbi:hypothetical protein BC830DRAFT_1234484 [Chytriomyces sp. MP71]|nr:hypothetical protein BC830DRAFT_1234484 [Chytriomyces sp. MP71]